MAFVILVLTRLVFVMPQSRAEKQHSPLVCLQTGNLCNGIFLATSCRHLVGIQSWQYHKGV